MWMWFSKITWDGRIILKIQVGSGTHKHTCKRGLNQDQRRERDDGIRVRDWRMRSFCFEGGGSLRKPRSTGSLRLEKVKNDACLKPPEGIGFQPWDFFGRNDAKAETPVLWPPHVKSWLIGKNSDAGRDWGQEEKGTTEDEMAGWHHWLDGLESEWTPGDGDGQGGLACCDSWDLKESDTTEQLNWTELNWTEHLDFSP